VRPVYALFFLAPLVAEFLLGDFVVSSLLILLILAPMYGGGALLVRESVRRTGRGRPAMVLLALAFGVFEEGLVTESLFNPHYAGEHLLASGYVPALGIAVPWTVYVLSLHTIWSISTPIELVEEATPGRRTRPWLRRRGMVVCTVLWLIGCLAVYAVSWSNGHYSAPGSRSVGALVVVIGLVVLAWLLPKPAAPATSSPSGPPAAGVAPSGAAPSEVAPSEVAPAGGAVPVRGVGAASPAAWVVFLVAVLAGAGFMLGWHLAAVPATVVMLAMLVIVAALAAFGSARPGWGPWHRFALAAAAVVTYGWHSFTTHPVQRGGPIMTPLSHCVFAIMAVVLLLVVARRIRRPEAGAAAEPSPADLTATV